MKTLKIYLLFPLFLTISLSLHAQNENIGIGTTNPQAKLHIAGDLQVEDLAGQGERTVIATPEGKLKAITNTEPSPSNTDTLRAQFIELTDETGDTRFIFNAHTGQFHMMDDDTLWYAIEVNSPPTVTKRFSNGEEQISSREFDIKEVINESKSTLNGNNDGSEIFGEAIEILETGTAEKVVRVSNDNNDPDSNAIDFTLSMKNEQGENITIEIAESITVEEDEEGERTFVTVVELSIKNDGVTQSASTTSITNDFGEIVEVTTNQVSPQDNNKTVSKNGQLQSQTQSGINEEQQPFSTLTDFLNSTTNTLFSNENTISNTETGSSVSTQIDEEGIPKVQLTDGGSTVTSIDAEKIEQTNSETGENASVELSELFETIENFNNGTQEQESQKEIIDQTAADINAALESNQIQGDELAQIAQDIADIQGQNIAQNELIDQNEQDINNKKDENDTHDEEIQNAKDCIDQLEAGTEPSGEITSNEFTTTEGDDSSNLKPTEISIQSEDGTKGTISPSGIILTASNGAQLFLDCNALSKFVPGKKSLPFVGVDFNINQEKLDVFADLDVFGNITELGKKVTKIDHPDHPTQQYLQHSTINTNELLHLYSGNSTTNTEGKATVQLPSYLQDLNTDFRYQLTVIGTFAQAIIAKKMTNNQFVIQTSEPNVKVSWQVTGVRNDAYAQDNPLEVEISD